MLAGARGCTSNCIVRRISRIRMNRRKLILCTLIVATLLAGIWLLYGHSESNLPPCPWNCGKRVLAGDSVSEQYSFNVSVYLEYRWLLKKYYHVYFEKGLLIAANNCSLPNGGKCVLQNSDESADVLYRMVKHWEYGLDYIADLFTRTRMCDGQLLAVYNSEAETGHFQHNQLNSADIRIDYHPSSHVFTSEICDMPLDELEHRTPPDPSTRKGIAMFVSNCAAQWRTEYLQELMKHVNIDSYGACHHNVQQQEGAETASSRDDIMMQTSKKYRMIVSFENTVVPDYISEKICLVYRSGAIPVYWGPPQIYSWVPGNHSFIDASAFTPKELAAYLKRVDQEDDLFRHHTTNLDIKKSRAMVNRTCSDTKWMIYSLCRMCQVAYKKKAELCHSLN